MPTIELCLRETIRLNANGSVSRRNWTGENVKIPDVDGEVPDGGFVMYNKADIHLDPRVYIDPGEFDPERYSPGREEDKKETYAYLGWGAGEGFLFLLFFDH
jgi:sterol 14-demethylase